jgi:hypothetical protein
MRKFIIAGAIVAVALSASAQVDQTQISVTVPTVTTNSSSAIVKGEIYSIRLDGTANKTQAVTIATSEGETVLAVAALAADATYYPLVEAHASATGAKIEDTQTATGTNNVWVKRAVASELVMTVVGAANTTGTNTTRAIITYKK